MNLLCPFKWFVCRLSLFALIAAWGGAAAYAAGNITGVAVDVGSKAERVLLKTDAPLTHTKLLTLTNPDRVVIDFPKVSAQGVALPMGYAGSLLKGIRFGQFDTNTSRVVLDLAKPADEVLIDVYSASAGGISIQLVSDPASVAVSPAADAPVAVQAFTYDAAQDEKPLIVIDAGHGGQDPGAIGAHKTYEKHVTLATARALRQALLRTGRYRVALTRDSDVYIMLGERVNIARKLKADMFISLHADSNPVPDAKGFSVYTISDTASDEEAAALAARENAVDELSGMDLGEVDKDVADILIDLASRETKTKSAQLADIIVDALHPKVTKLNKTHRYAGFRVLKAPDIPSVLIELGFLTNATDEKLLNSQEYREVVTSSIVRGIDAYYVTIKRR